MTTVRHYKTQDEKEFRNIAAENYVEQEKGNEADISAPSALQAYLEHVIEIQTSGKGLILVAEQENRLVGFVCLQFENDYVFMSDLYVIPESRNQGIGSMLTEQLEEQASVKGATHIALKVEAGKTNAKSFYKNKHYQEKFVVMSKTLNG
ncbi:hypothetical protein MNBD_GAMMA15-402 [hydrothermal vent metagenome]|uniref:N-acetyltransferase domain-containing protein n=1 Tax=hydrothermal vent metagenome TaxID=652676 RepID=A0A3B0XWZ7_9ZZZZ